MMSNIKVQPCESLFLKQITNKLNKQIMKQKVIRTYNDYKYDVDNNLDSLTTLLNEGWTIVMANHMDDTYVEYILQKPQN